MRTVFLVARREFTTRVRSRSYTVGTLAILLLLMGFVMLQGTLIGDSERSTIGLSGQATFMAGPLRAQGVAVGHTIATVDVANPADGEAKVRDGDLDALVTGSIGAPKVLVKDKLDDRVRAALNAVVAQQALQAQLAEQNIDIAEFERNVAAAKVEVRALEKSDPQQDQRLAVGLVMAFLLYSALVLYGQFVAQGVIEEKSSRVVELLLAAVRPWQLLLGKILGLGAVGLLQLVIVGGAALTLATSTGALDLPGVTLSAIGTAVLWYLLGFFLYATVYAAAGSLVSRQEDSSAVIGPVTVLIAVAFVVGVNLLLANPRNATAEWLSLLPPFAPILMPARMSLGIAPAWQILLAIALIIATIAGLTVLAGRIYRNAVLRTGSRVRLREALRG